MPFTFNVYKILAEFHRVLLGKFSGYFWENVDFSSWTPTTLDAQVLTESTSPPDLTPIFSKMLHDKAINQYFSERHYKKLTNIKVWVTSRQNLLLKMPKTAKSLIFYSVPPELGDG